jgi:hypothetical protein
MSSGLSHRHVFGLSGRVSGKATRYSSAIKQRLRLGRANVVDCYSIVYSIRPRRHSLICASDLNRTAIGCCTCRVRITQQAMLPSWTLALWCTLLGTTLCCTQLLTGSRGSSTVGRAAMASQLWHSVLGMQIIKTMNNDHKTAATDSISFAVAAWLCQGAFRSMVCARATALSLLHV